MVNLSSPRKGIRQQTPETISGPGPFFSDAAACHDFMVAVRWPEAIACPRCGSKDIGKLMLPRRIWKCKGCKKQFSVKVGTIFEDSPLGLDKWLSATWMVVNAKTGIVPREIHRVLGVTQSTGWFMLRRIPLAMQNGSFSKITGTCAADKCMSMQGFLACTSQTWPKESPPEAVLPSKPVQTEKPSQRFIDALRQILSVPKSELLRREEEYEKERESEIRRSHR